MVPIRGEGIQCSELPKFNSEGVCQQKVLSCCLKMLGVARRRERKDFRRKGFEAESSLAPTRPCESKATGANPLLWDTPEVHSSLFQVRICYMCGPCRKCNTVSRDGMLEVKWLCFVV